MGRPSKLKQSEWDALEKRLIAGEKASELGREFGVSKASISSRFSKRIETIKTVANQIVSAENSLRSLSLSEQVSALTVADQLRSLSSHLLGAANYGAATAHRLSGIAHAKVQEIDDAAPLSDVSVEALKGIAALTRMANESSTIGLNLLNANKDKANGPPTRSLAEELAELNDSHGHADSNASVA